MMRQVSISMLAMTAVLLALIGDARAQENVPLGPENYECDAQPFAPFTLDLDNMAEGSQSGYFFEYNKLFWAYTGERTTIGSDHVSETIQFFNGVQTQTLTATDGEFAEIIYRVNPQDAPFVDPNHPVPPPNVVHNSLNNVGPKAGFAFGNRYELGYKDAGNGWVVGVLDGPEQNQTQVFGAPVGTSPPPVDPNYNPVNNNGTSNPIAGSEFALGFGTIPVLFETPPGYLLGFRDYMNRLSNDTIGTQRGILSYVGNYGAVGEVTNFPFLFFHSTDDINGNGVEGQTPITIIGPDGVARLGYLQDFDDLHKFDIYFDTVSVHNRTQTGGIEIMGTHELTKQHYMAKDQNNTVTIGYGARFLRLYDEFDVTALGSVIGDSFWNTSFTNEIVGPQVALQWVNERQRWRIESDARFMAGYNVASWNQNGLMGSELVPGALNRLLYARATSFSHGLQDNEFSPVGELRLAASYHVTSGFSLNVGYTGSVLGGIKRAAPSVHYSLPDMGYLDAGTQTLLMNGVDFGIEFVH